MARQGLMRRQAGAGCRSLGRLAAILVAAGAATACNTMTDPSPGAGFSAAPTKQPSQRQVAYDQGSGYKVGKPYQVAGRWYHPEEDPSYDEVGAASWYGRKFHGRSTANGETYDMHSLTAAHPTLPMPSYARVTNLENNRSVVVRINDRGPFSTGRIIDLSRETARILDFKHNGMADVRVQYVGPAAPEGDDGWLTTTVRENGEPVQPTMVASADDGADLTAATSPASGDRIAGDKPAILLASNYIASGHHSAARKNRVAATFALFDDSGAGVPAAHTPTW